VVGIRATATFAAGEWSPHETASATAPPIEVPTTPMREVVQLLAPGHPGEHLAGFATVSSRTSVKRPSRSSARRPSKSWGARSPWRAASAGRRRPRSRPGVRRGGAGRPCCGRRSGGRSRRPATDRGSHRPHEHERHPAGEPALDPILARPPEHQTPDQEGAPTVPDGLRQEKSRRESLAAADENLAMLRGPQT
jgi:hypothetical protein